MQGASGRGEDGAKGEGRALLRLTLLLVVIVSPQWIQALPEGSSLRVAALPGNLAEVLAACLLKDGPISCLVTDPPPFLPLIRGW